MSIKLWWKDEPYVKHHDEANEWIHDASQQMDKMLDRIRELESFILHVEAANCCENPCMTAIKGKEKRWETIMDMSEKVAGILEDDRFILESRKEKPENEDARSENT